MPIWIELRTERDEKVTGLADPAGGTFDAAGDIDRLLRSEDRSLKLLRYVDPYGDTMFNHPQMADLLEDLDQLGNLELTKIERRGLDRLRVMAEQCREHPHHYVWFIGD